MFAADILIAEDDPQAAKELKTLLSSLGYRVVGIAASGDEARQLAESLHPHVAVVSTGLQGGADALQIGSQIGASQDIPVIYLVDYGSQATIRRAGSTGPFGYIFRPFDDRQIFATIETALIRHQLESKLTQSRQWLNTTLTSIGDGVIATDEQGFVRFINPSAMEQAGVQQDESVGKPLSHVFSIVDEASGAPLDLLEAGRAGQALTHKKGFEGLLKTGRGEQIAIEANSTLIRDGKGKVYGMVLVFRDITRQRQAVQEIRRQADRAEALLQVASQLNSHLELSTVLKTICETTNRTLKASGTAVFLQSGRDQPFRAMAIITTAPALKAYESVQYTIPREILEAMLSRAHPVVVIQEDNDQPTLMFFRGSRKLDIKTLALAGLFRGDDLQGVLISAYTDSPRILPDDELTLLRGMADQAASAIENAELFEQVRAGREQQRQLAKSLVDVQEAERRHMARELHDHLGQLLTGLQFMLESSKNQATGKLRSGLEEIQNTVSDIIEQVREMSLNLRPSMLDDMGLVPALLWHIDRYTRQTEVVVNFQYDDLPKGLPVEVETAAYRIVQEALTNVARHAQVQEVFVGLVMQENALWVEVLDNGKGFDPAAQSERFSTGLSGMRERASLVGGYLVVESFLNQGTQIVAALPLTGQPLERRRYDRNRALSR